MSLRDVMEMPIRTFWSFANNSVRLKAEEDLQAMDVVLSGQSGEFAKQHREALLERIKPPVKAPVDHKAGIAKLRKLLSNF